MLGTLVIWVEELGNRTWVATSSGRAVANLFGLGVTKSTHFWDMGHDPQKNLVDGPGLFYTFLLLVQYNFFRTLLKAVHA